MLLPGISTCTTLHEVESESGLLALCRSSGLGWSKRLCRPHVKQIDFDGLRCRGWWRCWSRRLHLLLRGSSGLQPWSATSPGRRSSLLLPSLGLVELFTILIARLSLYLSQLLLLCDLLRLLCGRSCRSGLRLISRCLIVGRGLRRYVLELLVVALLVSARRVGLASTPGSA